MLRTLFKSRQMETCGLFVVCEISVWANCNRDAWSGPIWGFSNNCGELCIARHVLYITMGRKSKLTVYVGTYMQGGHIGGPSGCSVSTEVFPGAFSEGFSEVLAGVFSTAPGSLQRNSSGCSQRFCI